LPAFCGEELTSIVSTEDVQLLTSLFFHKNQPLLECSESFAFVFQEYNPYLTRLVICKGDDVVDASDCLNQCCTSQVRVYKA
jgi:hypothetical protein